MKTRTFPLPADEVFSCIESFIGSEHGGEGVKLEQQVVVTRDGYELLSPFPWDDDLLGP